MSASASTFTSKFLKAYFPDHLIGLVRIWYDDRYSSKVLFSSNPAHYLKVKVMDLESFNVKDLKTSYFPNYTIDFVPIRYGDRYSAKVLFNNTCLYLLPQCQGHRHKNIKIILKFLRAHILQTK